SSISTSICFYLLFSLLSYFLFFFFSLLPPPPTSTLFPYTTLFRSRVRRLFSSLPTIGPTSLIIAPISTFRHPLGRCVGISPQTLDRKSTRLNSSHVAISYAVFCLKKKKKKSYKQK